MISAREVVAFNPILQKIKLSPGDLPGICKVVQLMEPSLSESLGNFQPATHPPPLAKALWVHRGSADLHVPNLARGLLDGHLLGDAATKLSPQERVRERAHGLLKFDASSRPAAFACV